MRDEWGEAKENGGKSGGRSREGGKRGSGERKKESKGLTKKTAYGKPDYMLWRRVLALPVIPIRVGISHGSTFFILEKPQCMGVIDGDIWVLQPPDFPNFTWLYMQEPGPLFVRKCVREICEQVILPMITESQFPRGTVITGTPGIGKSALTNWVIAMIRSYFTWKDIYIHHAETNRSYLIQRNGYCYELEKKQYEHAVQQNRDAIVLIDSGGSSPPALFEHVGYAMVTATPKAIPKTNAKEPRFPTVYIPVWTRTEIFAVLLNVARKHLIEQNILEYHLVALEKRYEVVGGVVRVMFGNQIFADTYIRETITAISKAVSNIRPHLSLSDNQHKVLHIQQRNGFYDYSLQFASKFVKKEFIKLLRALDFDRVKVLMSVFIEENVRISMLQSGVGVVYEANNTSHACIYLLPVSRKY